MPWSVLLACAAVSWGSVSCSSGDDGGKAGAGPTPGAEAGAEASVDAGGSGGGGAGDASAPDVASEAACVPSTCVQLEAECGSVKDGCGGVLECGTCPAGKTCGGSAANKCGDAACTPKTCAQLGASCGQVSDGCASLLDCGWCTAPESCGGGGFENQCGCTCSLPHAVAECGPNGCRVVSCVAGWEDCNASAVDGCETDVTNDTSNCGGCDTKCALPNAVSACKTGKCAVGLCTADWGDCDGAAQNGCEINLLTSKQNCGGCDAECFGLCTEGECHCAKPCGSECCTTGQKCCEDAQMCWPSTSVCPLPR